MRIVYSIVLTRQNVFGVRREDILKLSHDLFRPYAEDGLGVMRVC